MDGGGQYNPRTVEEVFRDFKGRRAGMIKALTTGLSFFTSIPFFFPFPVFIFSEYFFEFFRLANYILNDSFFHVIL